jgi:hypothetical protein
MKRANLGVALAIGLISLASGALAAEFEKPPTFNARAVLGRAAAGASYSIANSVPSDGFLRNYVIRTSFGDFDVSGDQLLMARIRELDALDALEKTTRSKAFVDALVTAGRSPFEFAGHLATSPGETLGATVFGVGHFLGGVASGVRNAGKTEDNLLESVSGAAKQRRLIAYRYGVDPYTDFKPLAQELEALARAGAAGSLVVTGGLAVIPGGAGLIVSGVSTASTLNAAIRDDTPAQLLDMAREKLFAMGVDNQTAEAFLADRAFTPADVAVMVDAMSRMGEVKNLAVVVARASAADTRAAAYFARRDVELTAAYQERTHAITGFVQYGQATVPMATTSDGGVAGVFAIDALSWTPDGANLFTAISQGAKDTGVTGPKLLSITGTATALARRKLKALGWRLQENASKTK